MTEETTQEATNGAEKTFSVPLRVTHRATGQRVPGAVVIFTQGEGDPTSATLDEDGDLPEELELTRGAWNVAVLHRDYQAASDTIEVPVPSGDLQAGKKVILVDSLTRDVDLAAGRRFFIGLIVALVALIIGYVVAHERTPERGFLSQSLLRDSAAIRAVLADDDADWGDAEVAELVAGLEESIDGAQASGELRATLEEADAAAARLATLLAARRKAPPEEASTAGSPAEGNPVEETAVEGTAVEGAEVDPVPSEDSQSGDIESGETSTTPTTAASGDDPGTEVEGGATSPPSDEELSDALAHLSALVIPIATHELAGKGLAGEGLASSYLWESGSKRYFEILFWAVAGILVRLIFTVGGYMRRSTFYRSGLYLHWALLICSPVLTVVFVALFSTIEVAAQGIQLELSDPRIQVAAAFLLSATPWGLWERLQNVGETIIGTND